MRDKDLLERITVDPKVMVGKPVIRGTRIPVVLILKMLGQGIPVEEILREYPRLEKVDIGGLAAGGGHRLPPGTDRAGEHLPERRHPGHEEGGD
jgi:uncharacterized protein (DUF433 family)